MFLRFDKNYTPSAFAFLSLELSCLLFQNFRFFKLFMLMNNSFFFGWTKNGTLTEIKGKHQSRQKGFVDNRCSRNFCLRLS
ncbi:unnamed protein product [Prunus brigantina]